MLGSKTKINTDTRRMIDLLDSQHLQITTRSVAFLEEQHLFKPVLSVIYSTLINFTAPVRRKMAALYLLKSIFQTAHPIALQECTRVIPVLADIIRNRNAVTDYPAIYFITIEGRALAGSEQSEQFVRFSKELLKQWAEYMQDCQETESPYFSKYAELSRKNTVQFPSWFQYFTLVDYIEFMLNWQRRKRKEHVLLDKLDIYYFLSSQVEFANRFGYYRQHLSQNAEAIANEAYSILVNHSLPVEVKFVVVKALKELYQEANLLFCERADELIMPYLAYIIELLVKQLPPEKYFERIERRLGIEPQQSRQYVVALLHLTKLWDSYNAKSTVNPYASLSLQIDKRNLLAANQRPNFTQQDIMRFVDNQNFGKHREPQYQEPPKKKIQTEAELRLMEDVRRLQRVLDEMRQREQGQSRQLREMQSRLQMQLAETNQMRDRMQKELDEARLNAAPVFPIVRQIVQPENLPEIVVTPAPSANQLTKERERHLFKCVEMTHPTPHALHCTLEEGSTLQRKLQHAQSQKNFPTLKLSEMMRLRDKLHYR